MSAPLVSVITPVFNAARFLPETLCSVRNQTFGDWEHILADDGSTDSSIEIIRRAAGLDQRIRFVNGGSQTGPARARNRALEAAGGRYVAFLDADDLWLPAKLERCLEWMVTNNWPFAYHDYRHISADGRRIGGRIGGPDVLDWKTLHIRRGVGSCLTVVIDRKRIPEFKFPSHDCGRHEDFVAWAQLVRRGYTGHRVPKDLGRYRISSDGRNINKLGSAIGCWRAYRRESRLSFARATSWWMQYAWNAYWMYRRGAPQ